MGMIFVNLTSSATFSSHSLVRECEIHYKEQFLVCLYFPLDEAFPATSALIHVAFS